MQIEKSKNQTLSINFKNDAEANRFLELLLPMLIQGGWLEEEELIINGQPIVGHVLEEGVN